MTRHGSAADYARVRRYARGTDFTEDAALEAFGAWVDVAHVTDYLIAQTFFGNYDIHNQNCWRATTMPSAGGRTCTMWTAACARGGRS